MSCDHRYPILVLTAEEGGCRARCLGCYALGPRRPNAEEARKALMDTSRERHGERVLQAQR